MNFMYGRSGFNYEERSSSSSSLGFPLNYCSYGGAPPEFNNYGNGGEEEYSGGKHTAVAIEREHMFDKVVTPSDVGKLNRLVIPKQYAEKYFPLDSSNNEKGLLLNFEDRNGKQWRFRYSYWNSSQSYVMTKGWSRFVKDKKLDAGDTVTFQRGLGDFVKDRLFINWRRRPDAPPPVSSSSSIIFPHSHFSFHSAYSPPNYNNWNSSNPLFYQSPNNYPRGVVNGNPCPPPGSIMYLQRPAGSSSGGGWAAAQPHTEAQRGEMVFDSVPVVQVANNNNNNGSGAAKRLRLFGVTMDCPISEATADSDILMPSIIHPHFDSLNYSINNHNNYNGKDSLSLDLDL